jgi:subtilisin family serine protease
MAAPHTAGVAALFLQKRPTASPRRVRDVLYGRTTQDIVKQSQTANDHLLFTSF